MSSISVFIDKDYECSIIKHLLSGISMSVGLNCVLLCTFVLSKDSDNGICSIQFDLAFRSGVNMSLKKYENIINQVISCIGDDVNFKDMSGAYRTTFNCKDKLQLNVDKVSISPMLGNLCTYKWHNYVARDADSQEECKIAICRSGGVYEEKPDVFEGI